MGVLVLVMLVGALWLMLSVALSTLAIGHIGRTVAVVEREQVAEDRGPHEQSPG